MLTDIEDNKTSLTIRGNYKDLAHAKLAKEINSAKQNFFFDELYGITSTKAFNDFNQTL